MAVTYEWYRDVFGGGLSEAAFGDSIGAAEAHVRWLCANRRVNAACSAYKRAVCAACDAFAEFGRGQIGGVAIGDFRVTRYASDEGVTGEDMATEAALKELYGTGYAFAGVR